MSPRHRVFKGGSISFELATGVACIVRNISAGGAMIEVDHRHNIPDEFSLILKPEMVRRSCRVVWRAGNHIGVQLLDTSSR